MTEDNQAFCERSDTVCSKPLAWDDVNISWNELGGLTWDDFKIPLEVLIDKTCTPGKREPAIRIIEAWCRVHEAEARQIFADTHRYHALIVKAAARSLSETAEVGRWLEQFVKQMKQVKVGDKAISVENWDVVFTRDDIQQATITKLIEFIKGDVYRAQKRLEAYLTAAAKNAIISLYRMVHAEKRTPKEQVPLTIPLEDPEEPTQEVERDLVSNNEMQTLQIVHRLAKYLSPRQCAVVELIQKRPGITQSETAKILGVSTSVVNEDLQQIRAAFPRLSNELNSLRR